MATAQNGWAVRKLKDCTTFLAPIGKIVYVNGPNTGAILHYIAWRWEQSSPQMHDDTGLTTLTQFWVLPERDATRVVVIESGFLDAGLPQDRLRDVHSGNVHGWELELAALRAHLEAPEPR